MTYATVINLTLLETGIRIAENLNWDGKVITGSHKNLTVLLDRPELAQAGLYILWSNTPETPTPTVYIGSTDCLKETISHHFNQEDGEPFWQHVAVLMNKQESVERYNFEHLANKVTRNAIQMNTVEIATIQTATVQTATAPTGKHPIDIQKILKGATIDEHDQPVIEGMYEKLAQILPLLGLNLFDA